MLDPKMKASEMDVRSYFAAMAMQGILANSEVHKAGFLIDGKNMAVSTASIFIADAMIAELNK